MARRGPAPGCRRTAAAWPDPRDRRAGQLEVRRLGDLGAGAVVVGVVRAPLRDRLPGRAGAAGGERGDGQQRQAGEDRRSPDDRAPSRGEPTTAQNPCRCHDPMTRMVTAKGKNTNGNTRITIGATRSRTAVGRAGSGATPSPRRPSPRSPTRAPPAAAEDRAPGAGADAERTTSEEGSARRPGGAGAVTGGGRVDHARHRRTCCLIVRARCGAGPGRARCPAGSEAAEPAVGVAEAGLELLDGGLGDLLDAWRGG